MLYDMMLENDGQGFIYVILVNYGDYNLDFIHELMQESDRDFGRIRRGGALRSDLRCGDANLHAQPLDT